MSEILMHAEGEAFKNGRYDLRCVDTIISNYRQIIDKSVPILLGHRTLTPILKSRITYEVEIRSGSLDILLNLLIENKDDVIALLVADGGSNLTMKLGELIFNFIEFRRKLTDVLDSSKKPSIVISNNINISLDNNSGTISMNNPNILLAADSTKSSLDRLIRGIDGKSIEDIQISQGNTKETISRDDLRITGSQMEELPSHIDLVGRLDTVAFTAHRGKVITGNGTYPVTWGEDLRNKIQKCADRDGVVFKARPIIDNRRARENTVAFFLLDCCEGQQKMF